MPMPQGTFLQNQKIARVQLRAKISKTEVKLHQASARRRWLRALDTKSARNQAYLAHDFGSESSERGQKSIDTLASIVEQLDDLREELERMENQFTELREVHFEFRAVTAHPLTITPLNVVNIAMAAITLLMVIEKLFSKTATRR